MTVIEAKDAMMNGVKVKYADFTGTYVIENILTSADRRKRVFWNSLELHRVFENYECDPNGKQVVHIIRTNLDEVSL